VRPYPNHFAFAVLAFGATLAIRARTWPRRLMVLGLTLLAGSYVRPELAVSFLLCCVAAVVVSVAGVLRTPRQTVRHLAPVLLVLGCAGLLLSVLGNPLAGTRSFVAFSQHYAFNVVTSEQSTLNAFTQFATVVERDFGKAANVR